MVIQTLRQELLGAAEAVGCVGGEGGLMRSAEIGHDGPLHRVDDVRAFKHMVCRVADHGRGVDLVIMVEQARFIAAFIAHCNVGKISPFSAQNRAIGGEEISGGHGCGEEYIIVEIEKMFRQLRDAPQHGFNRQRIKCGQRAFISGKYLAVINNANLGRHGGRKRGDIGNLPVGHNPHAAYPWRIIGDGAQAEIQFIATHPAVGIGTVFMQRALRSGHITLALFPKHRVRPIHPSDHCINVKHGPFYNATVRFTTIEWMCGAAKVPHWVWDRMNAARALTFCATNLIISLMGKSKNSGKAILSGMLFFWLLFLPHPVMATQMREGWVLQEGSEPPTWIFGQREAVIMVAKIAPGEAAKPIALVQKLDVPGVCPGLSTAPASKLDNGKINITTVQSSSVECAVASRMDAQSGIMVFAFQVRGSKADALNYAASLMRGDTHLNEGPSVAMVTQPNLSDAALRAAMASIPAANRPIDMVLVSEWNSVSMGMTYNPRIIFANGYAVDECDGWDLSKVAPTPSALKAIGSDCSVARWKKTGRNYVFQNKDGDWSEPGESGYIKGFQLGARINIDFGYVSSYSNTSSISSSISLSGGGLKLTSDGAVGIGNWSSVSNRSIWGGGSASGQSPGIEGRYLLEGYVIAIQAKDGSIFFGTIGQKQEDKLYIYLNGEMYWKR